MKNSRMNIIYLVIRIAALIFGLASLVLSVLLIKRELYLDSAYGLVFSKYRYAQLVVLELFLIYLFIFPYKFESIAVFSFIYVFFILHLDPFNDLSIYMYFLAIISLYSRGLLDKKKGIKIPVISLGWLYIMLSNYKYGKYSFLEDEIQKIICTFICLLIFIFIVLEHNKKMELDVVLDLSQYPELTDRDKDWIELALTQVKYDTIAYKYNLSPNYVKNRMRVIFKILNVPDRLSLLATYSGCKIKR